MITAVFLICSCALLIGAIICFALAGSMSRRAIRTRGRIIRFMPLGKGGQLVPMVEFTDQSGRLIQHSAQRAGAFGAEVGKEVNLLYTHKKVLGMDAWNIFICAKEGARPFRIYTAAGFFLLAFGILLAVLSLWLG